jgi:cytochrome c-type biogenesis protein
MTRVKPLGQVFLGRHLKKILLLPFLFCGAWACVWAVDQLIRSPLYQNLEQFAFWGGEQYDHWFNQQSVNHPLLLMGLAFMGGLVASISPCILSLLPVNLSYIGTREITSRRDAFMKAGAFVLGVVTVLSVLGLFSSLAGFVLVKFRGYFHLVVGAIIILMGLTLAEVIRIPVPSIPFLNPSAAPNRRAMQDLQTTSSQQGCSVGQMTKTVLTGPYGVGLTFALVSSPCTSPVMFSVLAAAAATGSQVQSTVTMVSYALGYSAIIFLASVFAGLAKRTRVLLGHSEAIAKVASFILLLTGAFYLINGGYWILSTL